MVCFEGPPAEFAQLTVDFGFGIELSVPRRGNQKGSVEDLVGWVKGSSFPGVDTGNGEVGKGLQSLGKPRDDQFAS